MIICLTWVHASSHSMAVAGRLCQVHNRSFVCLLMALTWLLSCLLAYSVLDCDSLKNKIYLTGTREMSQPVRAFDAGTVGPLLDSWHPWWVSYLYLQLWGSCHSLLAFMATAHEHICTQMLTSNKNKMNLKKNKTKLVHLTGAWWALGVWVRPIPSHPCWNVSVCLDHSSLLCSIFCFIQVKQHAATQVPFPAALLVLSCAVSTMFFSLSLSRISFSPVGLPSAMPT